MYRQAECYEKHMDTFIDLVGFPPFRYYYVTVLDIVFLKYLK